LRAPREHGAVLAEPALDAVGPLLARNRQRLKQRSLHLLGRPLDNLQREARQSIVTEARDYLRQLGEPMPEGDSPSLFMAGHQPELYHPGVWAKNFVLNGLARKHGAAPVNLVVDNDTVKAAALHVPVFHDPPPIEEFQPRIVSVPYDRWTMATPYEERTVQDEELFRSFPERIPKGWGFTPLLDEFWTTVCQQAQRTNLLGERLASARRIWERRWGCHNLEVPVSRVCQTEAFAWFACHLLAELPRFHAIYNESVRAYRQAHGLRSRNHPVPDLAVEGDWLEAPFWAWRAGQTRRGRLMARRVGDRIELRAGDEAWPSLAPGNLQPVAAWRELESRGLKVRSRALTNTLYARLFLADLFIHGIGGGKYDELTDTILQRFYGIEPPGFLVFSATLLLPFPTYPARAEDCRRLAQELRDLHWNPQRHVNLDSEAAKLALAKQAWMNQQPTDRHERRERFRALRELTEHLRQYTVEREEGLRREHNRCELQVQANAVLQRRDYAFCLYPADMLREFCTRFL
jgi:hypothetical protein